jgi:hypothetical protein
MEEKISLSKKDWGPIIWNMYHTFAINYIIDNKNNIDLYDKFINCLGYILPCDTCRTHYNYIITDIYPLEEDENNNKKLFKYTYEIHKLINETLSKENISYKKAYEIHKTPNNKDIIFIIKTIYLNLEYKSMSFYTYDKIYNFFISFCKLYPEKEIRLKLKKIINSTNFHKISSTNQFHTFIETIFIHFEKIN